MLICTVRVLCKLLCAMLLLHLHLDLALHQLQRRLQPQLRNQCCRDLSVGVVLLAPLVFKKKVPQTSKNGAV